jgi:hypothetical protein
MRTYFNGPDFWFINRFRKGGALEKDFAEVLQTGEGIEGFSRFCTRN